MHDYRLHRAPVLNKLRTKTKSHPSSKSAHELIRLASYVEESIVDGPGMRFVVFVQGCPHRCPGCHNPSTHLTIGGTMFDPEKIINLYDQYPDHRGITLSGGEPFTQAKTLLPLAQAVHDRAGDVITYSGYRWEQLTEQAQSNPAVFALLDTTDLLVDGPFVMAKRCLDEPFVGSTNQRLIALSPAGNDLLNDIPYVQDKSKVSRIYFS